MATGSDFGTIDGALDSDTLDYSNYIQPVTVNLEARTTSEIALFTGIETVLGSSALNTIIGPVSAITYAINGPNSTSARSIQFASFGKVLAGPGNEVFSVLTPNASLSGLLDGGDGQDSITAFNTGNLWNLVGDQNGALAECCEHVPNLGSG